MILATDQPLHIADGLFQADHDGAGDDAVANVQLANAEDSRNGLDVALGQAVAGVQGEARGQDELGGLAKHASRYSIQRMRLARVNLVPRGLEHQDVNLKPFLKIRLTL
jgi:hypothetical protein